jgi:hypothetical protein
VSRLTLTQRFLKSQPVEIAALKHRIGTPAASLPARAACIDSFAHACDFFPSADCDAACPRGDCGPTSRDKQRQRCDRRLSTGTVAIVAADSDHLKPVEDRRAEIREAEALF